MDERKDYIWQITITKNDKIAKEILTKFQYVVYKTKSELLFKTVRMKLKSYLVKENEDKIVCQCKGDKEMVEREKKQFEEWILNDEKTLDKSPSYDKFRKNRLYRIVLNKVSRKIRQTPSKLAGIALGGGTVLDFFNRAGLSVEWGIK